MRKQSEKRRWWWREKEHEGYSKTFREAESPRVDCFSLAGEDLLAEGLISVAGVVKDVCVTEHLNPESAASCNQAPELRYSLAYDPQKAELRVALLEGKDRDLPRVILRLAGTSPC